MVGFNWNWFSGHLSLPSLIGQVVSLPLFTAAGIAISYYPLVAPLAIMRNPSMPIVCCTVFIGGLCFSVTSVGTCYAAGMAPALLATSATLLNLACLFFGRTPDDDEPPSEPGPPLPLYISYLAGATVGIYGLLNWLGQ